MFQSVIPVAGLVAFGVLLSAHSEAQQSSPSELAFRDVAVETGLLPAAANTQGHGAGWGDVDGDGWADLYLATFHYPETRPNLLLRNRNGKFQLDQQPSLRISTRGTGVVFADLDNDGDLDLYVGSMPAAEGSRLAQRKGHPFAGCSLFRNDGDGRFTDISAGNGACPPAFGGRSATVLDIDGDGLLDLLVGEEPVAGYNGSPTKTSRMFRNLGGLKFQDVSAQIGIPQDAAGLGVAAADVNGDGWPDFFLASTIGNYLMLNDKSGNFRLADDADDTFAWPTAKGDNMVCGVAIADVSGDGQPDIVLGQHFDSPWKNPVANRLYLHRGITDGVPRFEDVTESAGLVPLPMKSPHVEVQDFDNDGLPDIYTSVVMFADGRPHPVIFQNLGSENGLPRFAAPSLTVNDFPTADDRAVKRSGTFFEKMLADRKVTYAAPGPTCDFDRDGRLDMVLPSWWPSAPTMLLKNETPGSGNWLQVRVEGDDKVNSMGIGAKVQVFAKGNPTKPVAWREIATGFGYASSQEAVAHFGLGQLQQFDLVITLPHGNGVIRRSKVAANQRITITCQGSTIESN